MVISFLMEKNYMRGILTIILGLLYMVINRRWVVVKVGREGECAMQVHSLTIDKQKIFEIIHII
jgi:hypothetical protein